MSKPNKHKDLSKPFWAAITEVACLIHYGKISGNNVVRSKYVIKTFVKKEDMINFIQRNGSEYMEFYI
jgi:hypothetical protein